MTDFDRVDEFLSHHGVLGMKWGRHLAGRSEASHNPKPTKRVGASNDHAEAHTLRKQPISTLSTSELRKVNERLQAEKKYKELNPTVVKKGHNAVKALITIGALSASLAGLASTPLGKAGLKAGESALSNVLKGSGKHVLIAAAKTTAKHL